MNLTEFCLGKKLTPRESKLSLVTMINQKKVGFCLIPKAASTTISLVMLTGSGFITQIENATNDDLRMGDQRLYKSCNSLEKCLGVSIIILITVDCPIWLHRIRLHFVMKDKMDKNNLI